MVINLSRLRRIDICRISERYYVTPVFDDDTVGKARSFDSKDVAVRFAEENYPGVRLTQYLGSGASGSRRYKTRTIAYVP